MIATPHSGNVTSDTDIAQEAWLSKRSLADHYDYSIRWVEDQMRRGMPSRRVGVQPRFRVSETDAWLDALAARRDVAPGAIASDASFEELAA